MVSTVLSLARRATVLVAVVMAALAAVFCRPAPPPGSESLATPGYILISIDTLRADHLGLYGYHRDTSPFLDSLASRALVFEQAFAQLPGTLPSHMSLFTGLYPGEHGVYPPDSVLAAEIESLPEVFARRGFRTGGFTEGGYVAGHFGFSRGFEVFRDDVPGGPSDVEETLRRGLEFLDQTGSRPFFLFLHTYAVHDPYDPPQDYARLFWQEGMPETFLPTGPNFAAFNLRRGGAELAPLAAEYYKALYDAGIRYLDDVMRSFFRELEERGLLSRSTIVVTSDHGEEFLEHGRFVHEQAYREALHVPLLVHHPRLGSGRIPEVVELVDVAPTLLDLAGLQGSGDFSGASLRPLLLGQRAMEPGMAYGESFLDPVRSLIVESGGGRFLHLLHTGGEPGDWVTRGRFFALPSGLSWAFEARSYHEARDLEVLLGDEVIGGGAIRPDAWTTIQVALPHSTTATSLLVRTDTCSVPAELGESPDRRCLSYRARGLEPHRVEVYDLQADPLESVDLVSTMPEISGELLRQLQGLEHRLRVPPRTGDVPDSVEDRLRALGYVTESGGGGAPEPQTH